MSSTAQTSSWQMIFTATITAVTTIGVSFIGIVPQLRSGDKAEVEKLKKEFETFKTNGPADNRTASSDKTVTISGTVASEDGTRFLIGYDIYLLPEGNNLLTTKTDDTGKFNFQAVPHTIYSIIVRDASNGKSGRALLEDNGEEVKVIGAKVKYRVRQ